MVTYSLYHPHQVLVGVAAVGMAVKLATGLSSGFLVCIVNGTHPAEEFKTLSGPFAGTLAAYAAQDSVCHDKVKSSRSSSCRSLNSGDAAKI
jgi:hypothetical protein